MISSEEISTISESSESSEVLEEPKKEDKFEINDVKFDFATLSKESVTWGVGVQKDETTIDQWHQTDYKKNMENMVLIS